MTIDKNSYGVVIGFGGMALCLAVVLLAQLFGKFRHVMPQVREWLIAHGDALGEIIRGALA